MPAAERAARLQAIAPQFLVEDVVRTAEWYRDRLGFRIGEYYASEAPGPSGPDATPPAFVILERDGVRLQLNRGPPGGTRSNRERQPISVDAYVWVEGIHGLWDRVRTEGVTVLYDLQTTFYGVREFAVEDCDGHFVAFGEA